MWNVQFWILFNCKQDSNSKNYTSLTRLIKPSVSFWVFFSWELLKFWPLFFHPSTRGKTFCVFLCIKHLLLNQNFLVLYSLSRRDPAVKTSHLVETWDPNENILSAMGLDEMEICQLHLEGINLGKEELVSLV